MASIYWYDEVTTTDASTIVSRNLRADEIFNWEQALNGLTHTC